MSNWGSTLQYTHQTPGWGITCVSNWGSTAHCTHQNWGSTVHCTHQRPGWGIACVNNWGSTVPIWSGDAWSGFGPTHLVWKQAGVQKSLGPLLGLFRLDANQISAFTRWESTAHYTHQQPDWGITSLSNRGSMAHVPFTEGLDSAHLVWGLTSARNWGSLVHISLTVGPDYVWLDWRTICVKTDWVGSCYTHQGSGFCMTCLGNKQCEQQGMSGTLH